MRRKMDTEAIAVHFRASMEMVRFRRQMTGVDRQLAHSAAFRVTRPGWPHTRVELSRGAFHVGGAGGSCSCPCIGGPSLRSKHGLPAGNCRRQRFQAYRFRWEINWPNFCSTAAPSNSGTYGRFLHVSLIGVFPMECKVASLTGLTSSCSGVGNRTVSRWTPSVWFAISRIGIPVRIPQGFGRSNIPPPCTLLPAAVQKRSGRLYTRGNTSDKTSYLGSPIGLALQIHDN